MAIPPNMRNESKEVPPLADEQGVGETEGRRIMGVREHAAVDKEVNTPSTGARRFAWPRCTASNSVGPYLWSSGSSSRRTPIARTAS